MYLRWFSPKTLTEKPWRKIVGWDKRKELKEEIKSLVPRIDGDIAVEFYKIILTGTCAAGKSSFFNSINSVFTNRVVTSAAPAGNAARSLTKSYFEHKIYQDDKRLAFRICDTMGLTNTMKKVDVDNILAAMEGHVPHEHEFAQGIKFKPDGSGYIENPSVADMAHCVAFVTDATTIDMVNEEVWENLRYLWKALNDQKVPMFIILTHVDEKCEEVQKSVENVYRSIVVRDVVQLVSSKLCGIPGAQIFPVINYKDQTELENDMDVLLLYALRQILYAAQANLNNR